MENISKIPKIEQRPEKDFEKKDILDTKKFETLIAKASPSTLEQCWNVLASGETWVGISALIASGYMGNQIIHHESMIKQNILDTMQHTPTVEEMKNMLLMLKVFATSVGSMGVVSTLMGIVNRKENR